jgi:NADH dehydrogenase/NADH:ubiquinone oxidoreductase subunit G
MSAGTLSLTVNGLPVTVPDGTTVLEACRMYGIEIPTLCHVDGLTDYGACRLCIVEIGPADSRKVVSSCTHRCEEGQEIHTHTKRVVDARKILLELMVCSTPGSKTIQDLAAAHGVLQARFKRENEECILCGLCVRMCKEQMMASAIDFAGRGPTRRIVTPFDRASELCRHCGGCMYICPACSSRCMGPSAESALCSSCLNLTPSCIDVYGETQCWMPPECGTCVRPRGSYLPATGQVLKED